MRPDTTTGQPSRHGPNLATTLWLFGIFGEHQVMAHLIAKGVVISSLIHKEFPGFTRNFQFTTLASLVAIWLP
jgi:hypothetical protein